MYFDAMLQKLADMAGNTEEVDFRSDYRANRLCETH